MWRNHRTGSLRGDRGGVQTAARRGPDDAGPMDLGCRPYDGHATTLADTPRDRRVSQRIGAIAESATLKVDAKAKALKAEGRPVIGFGAGEPDFPTPDYIVEAAVEACRDPKNHRYTPAGGLPELKKAIAAKTARDSGLEVEPAQVLVTNGGKQAIYAAFAAMLDPGDEVIVPAPYWTTYPEAIQLAGGVTVEVLADETQDYKVTVEQLEAARTDQTKVLLFVSPSNPTGAVYTADEIRAIGALGRGARAVGADRRDLRAPRLRRRRDRVDARAVPGARRQLRRRQRRGQDLRDDRLAGRLDDRPDRPRQGGHQPAVARHVERLQRRSARRPRRGDGRPVGGRRDEGGVRPAPHDHRVDAQRDRRRRLPDPARRVLRLPVGQGAARQGARRPADRHLRRARRVHPRRGRGGGRAG